MPPTSNFDFLKHHDELLYKLAETAERCFVPDPNTTLVKMRQLGEALAQDIASRVGVEYGSNVKQIDLLRELDYTIRLDPKIKDAFHTIRKQGNDASHQFDSTTHRDALAILQIAWALSCWFHKTFGGVAAQKFKPGKFSKPQDPSAETRELEERIRILEIEQNKATERIKVAEALHQAEAEKRKAEQTRSELMAEELSVWESIAQEQENDLKKLKRQQQSTNKTLSTEFSAQSKADKAKVIQQVEKSLFDMSEAETRQLIDAQLREKKWIVDSDNLKFSKGARPEKGRAIAISEWPTTSGPADYVLFNGLTPVAVIEAKKARKNAYSAIDQAKRYATGLQSDGIEISTTWGDYKVPAVFATNGRPYLKQLKHESGIWFLDVRDECNQREVLHGWYTPRDFEIYLNRNIQAANSKLDEISFQYEFSLRPYQIDAIKAVEQGIKNGQNEMLVAMATGTGKTKTCIALVYRLLKAGRFRRILFLVDRSALGEQAANAFNETRMESMQTFTDRFSLKVLTDKSPDDDTRVHIATVQGMVKRILYAEGHEQPSVGQYDCIVVDECHRGYLLDRELSVTELEFRDQNDYISKYRTVIEYFHAVKIGLTATPALHTSEIFGNPVYTYTYPEAVVDGFLTDHLPPLRIVTQLSQDGIKYKINEQVTVYKPEKNQVELFRTPDEIEFDVSQFNKQVENDAIQKITGQSDKPLEKIRYYKNDRLPNIAVTVDLLTTGIDVPAISNLVFLRNVQIAKAKVVDSHVTIVRTCEQIDSRYLFYWIMSPVIQFYIESLYTGTTNQVELSKGKVLETLIPLAPLNEQIRIANKLDQLLAKVDAAKARLDKIPTILKRFRQSVLAAATSGRLTEEWRGESVYYMGYPSRWTKKGLSTIGELARGKSKHRPRNDPKLFGKECPFIQTGEVANSGGRIIKSKRLYSEFGLQQSRLFPAGTLCITIAANIADTGILDIDACFPDSVVAFIPNEGVCKVEFVKYLIDVNKTILESFAPATAQKNINLKVLNELLLPIPSIDEQTEIVRRVEDLFALSDTIEKQYKTAKNRVDKLTQSILAKAFRGELVPQDPNDEPAEVLLQRIRAERKQLKVKKLKVIKRTLADDINVTDASM